MLRQLLELESCIVMWLNLDLLPCTVTDSWIDLDLCLTGSRVPGYIKVIRKFSILKDGSDIPKIVQQEVALNHVHSKQWIKGNVVNFICEMKSVPK